MTVYGVKNRADGEKIVVDRFSGRRVSEVEEAWVLGDLQMRDLKLQEHDAETPQAQPLCP